VKDVTVVIRNATTPSALPFARVESLFDATTGT
jgi:hypothetical protein